MAHLNRDQILKSDDLKLTEVQIPEWGGSVFVKPLTSKQKDQYEASLIDKKGNPVYKNIRARLAVMCVVSDKGEQLFTDVDIEALGNKSGAALSRIFNVVLEKNNITEEDLGDLEKN